ncbi:MAG TPA: VOC family protein [Candidatus Binataceae bacterium]|nr:VOC family protein [Candidatus Binataceae bacterium]
MDIVGIDALRFGVDDLDAARRYFSDWGLSEAERGASGLNFATVDGGEIEVRLERDPGLAPAVVAGPTLREVVWGVESKQGLEAIGAELEKDRKVARDADGTLHSVDTTGYAIAFRVSRSRPLTASAVPAVNFPGEIHRIDQRANFSTRIPIRHIGHAVFLAPNLQEASDFYIKRLGFLLSDAYVNVGTFMRAAKAPQHHTLFLLNGAKPGAHHVAFEVGDFHEVMMAGMAMNQKGWQTEFGPGRHVIGSNYFWYFKTPCGAATEYYADMDYLTTAWQPRQWRTVPSETIACWLAAPEPRWQAIANANDKS